MAASAKQHGTPSGTAPQPRRIWWRIAALLCLVFAVMLALQVFLNYSNYRKTYLNLNLSRHLVLAKDVRQTVEAGLNLGLRPTANVQLMAVLERIGLRQTGISYVAIADDAGEVVGSGALPALSPAAWRALAGKATADAYWQDADDATLQLGMPFANSFGGKAGVIVIGYARAPVEQAIAAMRTKLALDYLAVVALAALCVSGAVLLMTRSFAAQLERLAGAIAGALAPAPVPVPASAQTADGAGGDMADDVAQFIAVSREAAQALAQAQHQTQQQPGAAPAGAQP
ncbi:hypothetical protein ASC94_21920 [Massilia sp. Root418]|jgi:hypothetical protein|uniref:hypothetical protein n=1 Tax=Massilia sp. Root418 TaxID=1736532 RepID=UPI000715D1FA|nr:hypothetical protein [Massilia sp. Root418]KQW89119.1 hypothetical protein ASC94_21920 [Massilia sp. Root418]